MAREAPIALTTTNPFTLSAAAYGNPQAVLDSAALTNTYRDPIRVREIGFTIMAQPDVDPAPNALALRQMAMGSVLQARLATSGRMITNGFVPVWLTAAPITSMNAYLLSSEARLGVDWGTYLSRAATGCFYRWVLPQPLDLAPGQGLSGDLRFATDHALDTILTTVGVNSLDVSVTTTMLGHFASRTPAAVRPVPYVGSHIFAPGAPLISPAKALGNDFATPLAVQRLTSRLYYAASGNNRGIMDGVWALWPAAQDANVYPRVTVSAPKGYNVASDPAEAAMVFGAHRRGWDVRTTLADADDYFQVTLVDPLNADGAGSAQRLHVGLVGSRMERF